MIAIGKTKIGGGRRKAAPEKLCPGNSSSGMKPFCAGRNLRRGEESEVNEKSEDPPLIGDLLRASTCSWPECSMRRE
ncbi:hypothetical protein O3P69_010196 [Scylla paramamosain]|uniref:Uncharacterized protein n=1 Tax=Scylla paramamosain TaxID=85552 RepID=A0AAW0TVV9_SCYPA